MTDRRLLRRYMVLVHHADAMLELSFGVAHVPLPAEAVTMIEELVGAIEKTVLQVPRHSPDPRDLQRELAGWVH